MDLFAIVLVTLTLLTICGICLFIFICSLQPRVTHYFHRKTERTYYITAPRKLTQVNHHHNYHPNRLSVISTDRDKRMYIKILERSVRTGRSIQHERNRSCN